MGVFHQRERLRDQVQGLPHARGGVSYTQRPKSISPESSPRTWGCFHNSSASSASDTVFPTHVGVFLCICSSLKAPSCLPHARGGVSELGLLFSVKLLSSPRTWGCFYYIFRPTLPHGVFPTHVGVFLMRLSAATSFSCLPHARGGVSHAVKCCNFFFLSSPRTWGCFRRLVADRHDDNVFPTHVGVFLILSTKLNVSKRLPHARGGVSHSKASPHR